MNSAKSPSKKLSIALTTVNLFMWFWALDVIYKNEGALSSAPILAGIALMLAAWIQYRSVLESRSHEKKTAEPPQRNAGSRPSSGDSPASETPSSLGPRG